MSSILTMNNPEDLRMQAENMPRTMITPQVSINVPSKILKPTASISPNTISPNANDSYIKQNRNDKMERKHMEAMRRTTQ